LACYIWHRYFPCYIWHMVPNIDTYHAIFDTWYMTPVFDMLYLPPDIYNTWYLTPDTWHLYILVYSWLLCDQTSGTPVSPVLLYLLNSCTPEPLEKGDSWYYTHDIILLLIPVIGRSWLYCVHLWTLSLSNIYNKNTQLTLGGENWWKPVWCHIYNGDISEVSCGARNDKSPEVAAWIW